MYTQKNIHKTQHSNDMISQSRTSAENFPEGGQRKKQPKISKKYPKITLFSLFQGVGQRKKRPKNSKKGPKIALLSLYLLHLYHVWKSRGVHGPLPPASDVHAVSCDVLRKHSPRMLKWVSSSEPVSVFIELMQVM